MYDLNPSQVFVHKRVYENEKATIRLEKMMKRLGNPPFEEVDVKDTDKVIEAAGMTEDLQVQSGRIRQGIMKNTTDPVMLFNTFVWDADKIAPIEKKYNNPKARSIARHMAGTGRGYIYGKREI